MRLPIEGGPRQVEVDFGALPISQASFLVADSGVIPAMVIKGSVAFEPPTGKSLDELEMDALSLRFGSGAGFITINASGQSGPVSGKFKINYSLE